MGLIALAVGFVRMVFLAAAPAQRSKASLITLSVCMAAWVGYAAYSTSASALFRDYVRVQQPNSVRIQHAKYVGGRDPAVYLHFSIDPKDFPLLLKSRAYQEKTDEYPSHDYDTYRLGWWRTQDLKSPTAFVFREEQEWAEIWTNPERSEVFFKYLAF